MDASTSKTKSFSHQAAKLSWVCPIIIIVLMMFAGQIGAGVIGEMVSFLLMVAGLVFGIVALFGIRSHGKGGILAPAIAGIIINGLLVFIFVTNFLAARAKAQQRGAVPAPITHTRRI